MTESALENIFIQIPRFNFVKNIHSEYITCDGGFAISAGLNSPEKIRGKTDYDLPWGDGAELYQRGDREVLNGLPKNNVIEPLKNINGKIIQILTTKLPLLNQTGEKIGVIGHYMELVPAELRGQFDYSKKNIPLSIEEGDLLFYLAKGMPIRQIASLIELTLVSVEEKIWLLKAKLNCSSNRELIKKALSLDIIKRRLLAETGLLMPTEASSSSMTLAENSLTAREMEVLRVLTKGKTINKIALELGISSRTVETHLIHIKRKLNLKHREDLIAFYWKLGRPT